MGGSSGGGGTSTTTQKADPWSGIQPYLKDVYGEAQDLYQGFTPSMYPGQTYAPQNELQEMSQQALLGSIPQTQDMTNSAYQSAMFGLGPALYAESNPYLQSYMEAAVRPVTSQLLNQALPSIRSGATQAGQYGSSRQGIAEGLAIQGATRTAADIASQMASQGYESGLRQMNIAQAFLPQLMQMTQMPGEILGYVGGQQEGRAQQAIDEAVGRHEYEQGLPYSKLSEYVSTLAGFPVGGFGSSTSSTKSNTQQGGNPLMDLAGGMGSLILASAFGLI